jgi:hypothetical protein
VSNKLFETREACLSSLPRFRGLKLPVSSSPDLRPCTEVAKSSEIRASGRCRHLFREKHDCEMIDEWSIHRVHISAKSGCPELVHVALVPRWCYARRGMLNLHSQTEDSTSITH